MRSRFRAVGFRSFRILFVATALGFGTPTLLAQEGNKAWTPPPPEMPDKFDWVQVPSGEWFGGQIKVMYERSLEFDSEEIGVIAIDWEDVVELRSTSILEVRPEVGVSATGKVLVRNQKVRVLAFEPKEFDQAEILAITAGVTRERHLWSGEVSGSANYQSGNTDSEEFSGRIIVKRRTVEQRMVFEYIGNYDVSDGAETENNHRLAGDWAKFITHKWFWSPLVGEYFSDKFQNIASRITIGTSVGYEFIDTAATAWHASGGPAYTRTWFENVEPGESDSEDSPALQASTRFDRELTGDFDIWYDFRLLWARDDAGGYSHRMEFGAAYEIVGDLDLRVSYVWDYIAEPTADDSGEKPDGSDSQILFGIGYAF